MSNSQKKQRKRMQGMLYDCYQTLATWGASDLILDNVCAAMEGKKKPHKGRIYEPVPEEYSLYQLRIRHLQERLVTERAIRIYLGSGPRDVAFPQLPENDRIEKRLHAREELVAEGILWEHEDNVYVGNPFWWERHKRWDKRLYTVTREEVEGYAAERRKWQTEEAVE